MKKLINIGVFGLLRGSTYFRSILENNGNIVAICDKRKRLLDMAYGDLGGSATPYDNFDDFLHHPGLDAILLCNYFNEHAPYAIRALEKGSTCSANAQPEELLRNAARWSGRQKTVMLSICLPKIILLCHSTLK